MTGTEILGLVLFVGVMYGVYRYFDNKKGPVVHNPGKPGNDKGDKRESDIHR